MLSDRQKLAASLLAEGKSAEETATAVSRSPRTIFRWLNDPEFQGAMLTNLGAVALMKLSDYLSHGGDYKEAQSALNVLRWLGKGTPGRPRSTPTTSEDEDDDETDIPEFSKEQIRKLSGDDA